MKSQHPGPEYENLEWRVMDVRNMELEDGVFGVAIDKVRVGSWGTKYTCDARQ